MFINKKFIYEIEIKIYMLNFHIPSNGTTLDQLYQISLHKSMTNSVYFKNIIFFAWIFFVHYQGKYRWSEKSLIVFFHVQETIFVSGPKLHPKGTTLDQNILSNKKTLFSQLYNLASEHC